MSDQESLPETYYGVVSRAIDAEEVYPHQMLARDAAGGLTIFALDLRPDQVMAVVAKTIRKPSTRELIYSLDRYTKPGQGTELGDALAGAWWNGEEWRPFVIEYRHEPRLVKPMEWNNSHWNSMMEIEIARNGLRF